MIYISARTTSCYSVPSAATGWITSINVPLDPTQSPQRARLVLEDGLKLGPEWFNLRISTKGSSYCLGAGDNSLGAKNRGPSFGMEVSHLGTRGTAENLIPYLP